jgi:hypothetical protein
LEGSGGIEIETELHKVESHFDGTSSDKPGFYHTFFEWMIIGSGPSTFRSGVNFRKEPFA